MRVCLLILACLIQILCQKFSWVIQIQIRSSLNLRRSFSRKWRNHSLFLPTRNINRVRLWIYLRWNTSHVHLFDLLTIFLFLSILLGAFVNLFFDLSRHILTTFIHGWCIMDGLVGLILKFLLKIRSWRRGLNLSQGCYSSIIKS